MTHDAETMKAMARAMDDLLACAKGHVPPSAERFYDGQIGKFHCTLPPQEVSVKDAAKVLLRDPVAFRTMATAARRSQASCDETPKYPPLFELLDFSGENKNLIVVNAAIDAALRAISEGE